MERVKTKIFSFLFVFLLLATAAVLFAAAKQGEPVCPACDAAFNQCLADGLATLTPEEQQDGPLVHSKVWVPCAQKRHDCQRIACPNGK